MLGKIRSLTRRASGTPSLLLFLFLARAPSPLSAQSEPPIILSVGSQALTVPWYLGPVTSGFNPAFMVGTDHTMKSGENWRFFLTMNLGFFRNQWWMTGVSLEPEIGVGRILPGGFEANVALGLGYLHYFWRRKSLELKDGRYVESTNWGNPSVVLPLSVTLGYRGASDHPLSVSPFVSARWAVQGLFLNELPAMTHLFLLGGVRIDRGRASSSEGR